MAFASAGALALVAAASQMAPAISAGARTNPAMLAAAMSNQNLVAYVCRQAEPGWNLPTMTFKWTNPGDALYPVNFPNSGKSN